MVNEELIKRIKFLEAELASLGLRAARMLSVIECTAKGYREIESFRDTKGFMAGVTIDSRELAKRFLKELEDSND